MPRFGGTKRPDAEGALQKCRCFLGSIVIVAWVSAVGNAPWTAKSPRDWDRSDVQKILYDSPWAKHFFWTRKPVEAQVPDFGPEGLELRGYHAKESKEDGSETREFFVRWVSSRTLGQASQVRSALLKQASPTPQITPPPQLGDYEVAVTGRDMSDFEDVAEAALRAKCLLIASSRRSVRPIRVEIAHTAQGNVRAILFRFSRRTSNGEPLISIQDKKVLFLFFGAGLEIRITFNPQDMRDSTGLDL